MTVRVGRQNVGLPVEPIFVLNYFVTNKTKRIYVEIIITNEESTCI